MDYNTVCQSCIFYDKGCTLGIIENAKKAGVTVLDCWNEEGEFNVLVDTQCMYHRPQGWADKKVYKHNLVEQAAKEIECAFSAFVVCNEQSSMEDIQKTIDSLAEQNLKPDMVVVIREFLNTVDPKDLLPYMQGKGFANWKIENLTDENRRDRQAVELALRWKPRPYFATFRAGRVVEPTFFSDLNEKITKHFYSFGIISNENDPIDGVVVSKVVLSYFKNQFDGLEELIAREKTRCQTNPSK